MTREIASVVTSYDWSEYRSRTEARWAAFLQALGVRFIYEPRRYQLSSGGSYLPDFWIPEWRTFLEVKPDNEAVRAEERARMETFAADRKDTSLRFWISRGWPRPGSGYIEAIDMQAGLWSEVSIAEHEKRSGCFYLVSRSGGGWSTPAMFLGGWRDCDDLSEHQVGETSRIRAAYAVANTLDRENPISRLETLSSRW